MEPIGGSNAALTWQKIIDLGTDDVKKSVIAASMSDDAKLIAVVMNRDGTANPFLFTSTDGGQFFLFNPLNTQPFTCLDCCSTNSGNVLICGTNSGQLYWSSDSGQNLAAAGPTSDWTSVSINAVGSFAIACANGDFIYTSSDGGQTWSVPRAFALSWIQVMTDNAGTNCAAITSNQIWFSVDAGVSWANPSFAPADLQGPFTAVHLSPDGTQCFLANTSGTIFRKTVPAGAWSVFRNANGLDTGMSTDESKVLVVNTNFTSSYSQDGGTNFFTNDIRTNATPPMRVPLCFTTSGDNAIMATDGDGRGENASASTHRRGLAVDYRFGIGTANEFEISYYHLHYNDKPDWGFAWLNSRPAPSPTNKYWYGLNTDFQNDKADALTLSHTHRWADGSSLKTTLRDGYYSRAMTALGLAVAIPAVLGYNALVRGNKGVLQKLNRFAHDLHAYFVTGARVSAGGQANVVPMKKA